MHLVGAVGQAQGADAREQLGQGVVAGDPRGAEDLDGAVQDLPDGAGYGDLDGLDLGHGGLVAPAAFSLTSSNLTDGERMPDAHAAHDQNISPALEWSGFPAGTKSFVVTCYDPDAPTPMGYHHWTVVDLPASVTSLDTGAGTPDGSGLPAGAFHTYSDGHTPGFEGAGPPSGDHPHRYIFAVHALDVEPGELGLGPDSSNAQVAFDVYFHLLGRATLTATYSR